MGNCDKEFIASKDLLDQNFIFFRFIYKNKFIFTKKTLCHCDEKVKSSCLN